MGILRHTKPGADPGISERGGCTLFCKQLCKKQFYSIIFRKSKTKKQKKNAAQGGGGGCNPLNPSPGSASESQIKYETNVNSNGNLQLWLEEKLKPLSVKEYTITGAFESADEIRSIPMNKGDILVSYDVTALSFANATLS